MGDVYSDVMKLHQVIATGLHGRQVKSTPFPSRQKNLLNKLHCNDQIILLNTLIDTVTSILGIQGEKRWKL